MKKVTIINGPNLNLLGIRQPDIYGDVDFETFFELVKKEYPSLEIFYVQSNIEGELVTLIQQHGLSSDYLIVNAGGYTHTSVAIPDAIAAVPAITIGVHISNIYQREKERHVDLLAKYCKACLFGFGINGYQLALQYISNLENEE